MTELQYIRTVGVTDITWFKRHGSLYLTFTDGVDDVGETVHDLKVILMTF